jgi:hypothetical protein
MAYPVPVPVFSFMAVGLEWAMAVECLAELCRHSPGP